MKDSIERILSSYPIVLFSILIAMVWGIWSTPLYDLDEGAFTEATREMIASGNYISIYLNGEPRHDKPILIYWLQAFSVHMFGLNEAAFRLPSVIAGIAWVLVLFQFTKRHTDVATAQVAALLLTLSIYVGVIAKGAVADALLNLFLALAVFEIFNHFRSPSRTVHLRIFLWLGLGFLTNGPVAVVFPFLVSGVFYASYGRWREWLKLVFDPLGLVIFAAVVLPWHVAVYLDSGWAFFKGFYLHHNLDRYQEPMEGHGGSFFYYFLAAPLIILPFSGWFLLVLSRVRLAVHDPFDRFLWLWFFIVLGVFSLSGTKLPHYLLYGMSGVFVLMAKYRFSVENRWIAFTPALTFLLGLALSPWLLSRASSHVERLYEKTLVERGAEVLSGLPHVAILLAFGLAVVATSLSTVSVWRRLILIGIIQASLLGVIVTPKVLGVLQDGPKLAASYAADRDKDLVIFKGYQPSLSVYREEIVRRGSGRPGELVYVRVDHVEQFLNQPSEYEKRRVFEHNQAVLFEIEYPKETESEVREE